MRLGIFENFYPAMDRLGTHSTSLALLFLRADPGLELELVVPERSRWPVGFAQERVKFRPLWRHDGPTTMVRAAAAMARSLGREGHGLFNWFPTCYGQTRSASATGMLLPRLFRWRAHRRAAVYAHNFIETQDVGRLGYRAGFLERRAIRALEGSLARSSQVIVPLESQRRSVEQLFGQAVLARPVPFVEALYGHWCSQNGTSAAEAGGLPPRREFRILLFGVWGPAKDLDSVLAVLDQLYRDGHRFEALFAGSINRFFPEYRTRLRAALSSLPPELCHFVADPPDELTPALFGSSDLVILPYHAIAGPSGVMGLAAFHGCRIVAYDVPELREYDQILEGRAVFVPRGDRAALAAAIARAIAREFSGSTEPAEQKVDRATAAARRLLESIAALD
jgi:glycosyltransferase involved in cell wall biosynthesis